MKKLIFLPLCVFILFSTLLAQNVELTWAPDLNRENFILNDFNPFHLDDNAYYVLGSKRREASILKFDLNHNFISQTNYTDVKEKQHIAPEKKIEIKNFTYAYSVLGDAKSDESSIYVSQLFDDGFENLKVKYKHPLYIKTACMFDIGLEISPDSMLVAYVNDQKSAKQKENKSISVAVLSERLNLLWEKQIELDVPASRFEYVQSLVGNDGVVYVLARNFIPANEREVLFKPFEYVVYKLHHTGVEKRALETDLENILVDMKMSLNEETGELSLAGFYQNKFVGPGIQGIFYFSGNMEKGFDSNSFFTFDDELLAWFNSSKALEKNSGISESFFIKDQIRHPNGDWSLIAEDSFIIAEEGDDDEFHSYDVLVIRFSPSGELKHVSHVPKFFNDDVQYATSYSFATNQNNIYLLFNYTKQKEEFAEGEEKCFICTYTDLVIINQDGKVESASQLVKSKPRDGKIFPFASATKNGAFLIVSKYLRNSTLGLITVE